MTATLLAIAGTIVTLLTAVLGYVFGRKESNAKAEATTVETALKANSSLWVRLGAAEATNEKQEQELDRLARTLRIQGRLLIRHERWDAEVVARLEALGVMVPPPPNLDPDNEPDPNGPRTRASDYHGSTPAGPAERAVSDRRTQP